MLRRPALLRGRIVRRSAALLALVGAALVGRAALGQPAILPPSGAPGRMAVPNPLYYGAFIPLHEGEYRDALKAFQNAGQRGIRSSQSQWIDSICYYTMVGECYYRMGDYPKALDQYTQALQLYLAFPDWMIRVQFPPTLPIENQPKRIPWGQSTRTAPLGKVRDTYPIAQGQVDATQTLRSGGTFQSAIQYNIDVYSIVRCTALSIRRRHELLGPTSSTDALNRELVAAFSRRPGPPNHWSECWIDLQLGLAFWASGQDAQARPPLERAVLAAGQFDHSLTCMALFALGRMAFDAGDYNAAALQFAEAGFSAVQYSDGVVLEDAMRMGYITHVVSGAQGMFPPLNAVAQWANAENLHQLQASSLIWAAENACILNDSTAASNLLGAARSAIGRRTMATGRTGAELNFVTALASYQAGAIAAGDQAITAALAFQRKGSLWLFHIGLVAAGQYRNRQAMELFDLVLRDPLPIDWGVNPLEALSVLSVEHEAAFEQWFEIALADKAHERALEISDLARRHRFLTSTDLGGRTHALRWLLAAPDALLSQAARLERQELFARFPAYERFAQQAAQLQAELHRMGLSSDDQAVAARRKELLAQLASVSAGQELLLREISLRRVPSTILFPPVRTVKELRAALPDGHAVLSFYFASRQPYAFLMTNDKYGYWRIPNAAQVQKPLVKALQSLGNYDANRALDAAALGSDVWRDAARTVYDALTKDAHVDLTTEFTHLAIVPDGPLWYFPFEAVPTGTSDDSLPLVQKLGLRYAPTVALSLGDARPRLALRNTAVATGDPRPRDGQPLDILGFDRALPGAVDLAAPLPAPSPVYATLCDSLIVLAEIAPAVDGPYCWPPLAMPQTAPGDWLLQWFPLPFGGPDAIMLPGYRTIAEAGLKPPNGSSVSIRPGHEMFLSTMGLMANGARTILISRWRTGGQSSIDLVREFAQELPHAQASAAWQRAIALAREMTLEPALEPRLKLGPKDEPPTGAHPFFWAGYMVVDQGVLPGPADDVAGPAEVAKAAPLPAAPAAAAVPDAANDSPTGPNAGEDEGAEAGSDDPPAGSGDTDSPADDNQGADGPAASADDADEPAFP